MLRGFEVAFGTRDVLDCTMALRKTFKFLSGFRNERVVVLKLDLCVLTIFPPQAGLF